MCLSTVLTAQAQAPAQSQATILGDVIVTATRRETSLQDTPLAISAFDQATLDENRVVSLLDVRGLVPNLQFFENGDHALWPGQFVQVALQPADAADAVLVPSSAVIMDGTQSRVLVLRNDLVVTNEGWTQYGGPVATLSAADQSRCETMLAMWTVLGVNGGGHCSPVTQ